MIETLDLSVFPEATWDEWRAMVEGDLSFTTLDGLRVQPLYGPAATPRPGFPGQPPFVRGGQPKVRWGMVQEVANPDLEAALLELEEDLRRDAAGVWLRFEDRLRNGAPSLDSSPGGLRVSSDADLRRILERLDLRQHKVFLDAGVGSGVTCAAFLAGVAGLGVSSQDLTGCLGIDPLADAARGARLPKEEPFGDLLEFSSWCNENAPGLRGALVSTSVYHDAGASPVQELAFAVASGTEILRRLTTAGLSAEEAARQILFAFSVTGDLFLEVAKLRAARQLWWRVASSCGVPEEAGRMVLHGRTSRRTSTVRDRGVNALRGTVETFAAVVGGADTVTTASFEEALGLAGAFGRKVAANTQLILREETFLDRVTDPAGGSWFVEQNTEQLAAAAWALFQEIEREGGFAAALKAGGIRHRVEDMAARRLHLLATRQIPITGVSEYPNLEEAPYHPSQEEGSPSEADRSFSDVASAGDRPADGTAPWPNAVLARFRDAEAYEDLCRRTERHLETTGERPKVFLANLGPLRSHRVRAGFVRNLLAAGGIASVTNDGFAEASACGEAFAGSGSSVAVLCGSDEVYLELALAAARELRGRGARRIFLAGRPGSTQKASSDEAHSEAIYKEAGVDGFLFQGCDVVGALGDLLQALGVAP